MENGWIKLHRKTLKNPIVCKDAAHLAIWVYLLLNATHEDYPYLFEGRKVILHPGQLVTGRKKLAAELDLSESKVHRVLKDFEIEQQIEQQTKAHGRLITITNWHQYQMCEQQTEQQVNNNRTTSEQQLNTKQENKELKKVKNKPPIVPLTDNEKVNEAIKAFITHRKTIKSPMSDKAIQLFVNRLQNLAKDPDEQVLMIETAIERGWKTIYPLKEEDKPKPVDDGLGEMERMYYANGNRYTGPDFFARRNSADSDSRESARVG